MNPESRRRSAAPDSEKSWQYPETLLATLGNWLLRSKMLGETIHLRVTLERVKCKLFRGTENPPPHKAWGMSDTVFSSRSLSYREESLHDH